LKKTAACRIDRQFCITLNLNATAEYNRKGAIRQSVFDTARQFAFLLKLDFINDYGTFFDPDPQDGQAH